MSDNKTCQYCNNILPDRGFYCPSCGFQVRCKSCFKLLELNANACIYCGTRITDQVLNIPESILKEDGNNQQSPLNTFEYRETQYSKVLKASFTDTVGNSLNETLNNFVGNRLFATGTRKFQPPVVHHVDTKKQLPSGEPNIIEGTSLQNSEENDLLSNDTFDRIFKLEDQDLILLEPRIKAKSKLDYSKKLTLLVIYYFTTIQQKSIDKTQLRGFLKKTNLMNNHLQSWLSKTTDITYSQNGLELNNPAKEQITQILKDMCDSEIPEGWMPEGKPRPSSSKKTRGKKVSKEGVDIPAEITKKRAKSSGKTTSAYLIDKLIGQGYFSERRTISEIVKYCSSHLAQTRKANELSPILTRYTRDGKLKRETNGDHQYEYYA